MGGVLWAFGGGNGVEIGATNGAKRRGDFVTAGSGEEELARAGEGEEDAETMGEMGE